jgi:dephospho-CoA kinase
MPVSEKIALADIVIDNKGTIADTEKKVNEVWQELLQREKQKNK